MASKAYQSGADQYFATLPIDQVLPELEKKRHDYEDYILRTGRLTIFRTNWEMYQRADQKIGIRYGGDRGQYKLIESNIYRSIVTGLVSVLANQRPSFQPEAINDDHKSMSQDLIFDSVSNYYLRVKRMEDAHKTGLTYGLICGEGWLFEKWNADLGETTDITTDPTTNVQTPIKEGDVEFSVLGPMDVARDFTRMNTNNDWYIVREYLNKWDLIKQRPDLQTALQGLSIPSDIQRFRFGHIIDSQTSNIDLIPVYTFIHRKTPSCPDGRFITFIDGDTWIMDTALPYDEIPLYPMMPDVVPFNNAGCTVMTSLVKLQYAYDKTLSVIVTNQQAFAIQNIAVDESTQIKPEQVIEGLNFIRTDLKNGVPVGLQLCKTPEEVFKFLDLLESQMEKLSGLPSILRGQPPTGVQSGTAMAFLQAQALVFNSPVQQSYISFLERSATGLFNILKIFANSKRMIAISGQSKKQYMGEFSSADLANISRVTVTAGNPATRSEAGKLQIAQDLMAKNMVTNQEYFQILETGQLDPMIEGPEAENMLIVEENEGLRDGEPQVVFPLDIHDLHIKQHVTVLMDPALRRMQNSPIVAATVQHVMEHAKILFPGIQSLSDPRLLALLGVQVVPPPPPPQSEAPTPEPVANPMPSSVANATPPLNQAHAAPRAPVLPRATSPMVANAAEKLGTAHLPAAKK